MSDRPGWVPCPTCEGSTLFLRRDEQGNQLGAQEEDCPDCSSGWVPSDRLVEIGARAAYVMDASVDDDWDDEAMWGEFADWWRSLARHVLIAADRYEREQAQALCPTCRYDSFHRTECPDCSSGGR